MLACSNHAITIIKLKYDLMVFSEKKNIVLKMLSLSIDFEASQYGTRSFFNDAMAHRPVISLLRQKLLECFGGHW